MNLFRGSCCGMNLFGCVFLRRKLSRQVNKMQWRSKLINRQIQEQVIHLGKRYSIKHYPLAAVQFDE